VVAQVSNGGNGMPAYRDRLTDQQIRDVATFVLDVAGRSR
jgi:mono/diheme cytochrome c family protein